MAHRSQEAIMRDKKSAGGRKKTNNLDAPRKAKIKFANENVARQWMTQEVDDPCVDNERFAYFDDPAAMQAYADQLKQGCCGFFDENIEVNGRPAKIGCNFGH